MLSSKNFLLCYYREHKSFPLEMLTTVLLDRTKALSRQVVEQSPKSAELTQKIEKLEARLNKNSGNANKPPSRDPPFKKPAKPGSSKPSTQPARVPVSP